MVSARPAGGVRIPAMVTDVTGCTDQNRLGTKLPKALAVALSVHGIGTGSPIQEIKIDRVLSDRTNSRLEDLRIAVKMVRGKRLLGVHAMVVPGSQHGTGSGKKDGSGSSSCGFRMA
jgi:homoaconitase/3-isopropylmalate dehydratase large subunit